MINNIHRLVDDGDDKWSMTFLLKFYFFNFLKLEKPRSAFDDVIGVTINNIIMLSISLNKLFMLFDET